MNKDTPDVEMGDNDDPTGQYSDAIFDAVSSGTRRYVLAFLRDRGRPVPLDELATQVAAWKREQPPETVSEKDRDKSRIALRHTHLPSLERSGLIERDSDGRVRANEVAGLAAHERRNVLGDVEPNPERGLSNLFAVLADPLRRTVVDRLEDMHDDAFPLSVETLANAVTTDGSPPEKLAMESDPDRVIVTLHHHHLPKLADAGIVTYDHERGQVGYDGHPLLGG